ncbi:hypothetical protein AMS68_007458 [Peltaster fructicola]|uniref:ubiquitinyl hydrolase 1 n=1 Tax=Peltaster fructicola TaxID=286661 RepID=A0A6H0Y4U5_9PEZI|nr:hypothetical protein AMS68_007458 [Peltaster fructicola]
MLAMQVSEQNAGVIITRSAKHLVFECFELLPGNEDVMGTKGRLIRTVPSVGIAIDADKTYDADFADMVSSTLAKMSCQRVAEMQPKSSKSGVKHDETRDTTDPSAVSGAFFAMLSSLGITSSTSAITKHTREEVRYKSAALPWRRSPMWLLLRVTLQLVIERSDQGTRALYKQIMLGIMAYLLEMAHTNDLSTDMVYIMEAKISRRLWKLGDNNHPAAYVHSTVTRSHQHLAGSWLAIQQRDATVNHIDMSTLIGLDFQADSYVARPELDSYLANLKTRAHNTTGRKFTPMSRLCMFPADDLPVLNFDNVKYTCAEQISILYGFEAWVRNHLSAWTSHNLIESTPRKLHNLMASYYEHAASCYANNPEAISLMVITLFSIWVDCDRCTVYCCPLLAEYTADISLHVFETLLLPTRALMEQLLKIESYLQHRNDQQLRNGLFVVGDRSSFAAVYVDGSEEHNDLLTRINREAHASRSRKEQELRSKQADYARLDQLWSSVGHETREVIVNRNSNYPRVVTKCVRGCKKCHYQRERDAIDIVIFEWPLPTDVAACKTIAFELLVPAHVGHWRDSRAFLTQNVLGGVYPHSQSDTRYCLHSDPHLARHHRPSYTDPWIGLLSDTKPASATHYKHKSLLSATPAQVCVPNGLRYRYFDSSTSTYPIAVTYNEKLQRKCTYNLTSTALNPFIFRPCTQPNGPHPNTVLAQQDTCPPRMSLEEFKDLATIPLGHRIQWCNIASQLLLPSINLKDSDAILIILQCIHQAGPSNGTTPRAAHDVLLTDSTAMEVLASVRASLHRLRGNWESIWAFGLFAAICTRVLALNDNMAAKSLVLLGEIRAITADWVTLLGSKADSAQAHADRTIFIARSVHAALVCMATLDVEDGHLHDLLECTSNVAHLVRMSIVVYEGSQAVSTDEPLCQFLRLRGTRLLCRSSVGIANNFAGLDDAIACIWPNYEPDTESWIVLPGTYGRWLTTRTAGSKDRPAHIVHLDILTGQLLVDGLPLDQPPAEYQKQSLYATLFGKAVVKVMSASVKGFTFGSQKKFAGYEVQLGMSSTGELIVQASNNIETIETLPSSVLEHCYPSHFQEDYVHWYNFTTGNIELRSCDDPWNQSSCWTLASVIDRQWRMCKGNSVLLGLKSKSSTTIARLLRSMTNADDMHLEFDVKAQRLDVDLVKLSLGFRLLPGTSKLRSRDHVSMHVASDQTIGTLTGLVSRLVLEDSKSGRLVLIPQSGVTLNRNNNYTTIQISKGGKNPMHTYSVDKLLGRLRNTGELSSQLWLAYLHALSSSCLPDSLTSMTGTEAALAILKSQLVLSFEHLTTNDINILQCIASLSPARRFYPRNIKAMQTVDWNPNLGMLAQHNQFASHVHAVVQHYRARMIFYPTAVMEYTERDDCDAHLTARDTIRTASFRTPMFGAEEHTDASDRTFRTRCFANAARAGSCATIAALYRNDSNSRPFDALQPDVLWSRFIDSKQVSHGGNHLPNTKPPYSAELLAEGASAKIVVPHFFALLDSFRQRRTELKYAILMWLAALAYSRDADLKLLQVLVLCVRTTGALVVEVSDVSSFDAQLGTTVDRLALENAANTHLKILWDCPEAQLPREAYETTDEYEVRQHKIWIDARTLAAAKLVNITKAIWPMSFTLPDSAHALESHIDIDLVSIDLKRLFEQWHSNLKAWGYLGQISKQITALRPCPTFDLPKLELIASPRSRYSESMVMLTDQHMFTMRDNFDYGRGLEMATALPKLHLSGTMQHDKGQLQTKKTMPVDPDQEHQTSLSTGTFEPATSHSSRRLARLLASMEGCPNAGLEKSYIADLHASVAALSTLQQNRSTLLVTSRELQQHLVECSQHFDHCYKMLVSCVYLPEHGTAIFAMQHGIRLSAALFLSMLTKTRWTSLGQEWKKMLVSFGLAITTLQRAKRLLRLYDCGESLNIELANPGHTNWDPMESPEALLIEIENDILIREVQTSIAKQMLQPTSELNTTVQLNMGQGKSTIIIPIVAIDVANGLQLARVIAGKPQSKQMAHMLRSKLGGLIDRRVYFMPFSRSLQLDSRAIRAVQSMIDECRATGGVMLLQPEHILSFQLMAPESHLNDNHEVGQLLSGVQDCFDNRSRDTVDECDENFSVKFELIYSIGDQKLVDGGVRRWNLIQAVLKLVQDFCLTMAKDLPDDIEVRQGPRGSFPRTRLLSDSAAAKLIELLGEHICYHDRELLSISKQPMPIKKVVSDFLTKSELAGEDIEAVEQSDFWTESTMHDLLLLRGLLARGLLSFVFSSKRWRVQYGTACRSPPTRLAVPYCAKDCPSPRSEFSHPDVIILLTTLSYYYEGLCDNDMFDTFRHLVKSDGANAEYSMWVKDADALPEEFHELQGINLKDKPQCLARIFPALRYNKCTIDYFLGKLVFPREMKEFPYKLSASGWDLAKPKSCLTTGFSGTNDSRHLLPNMIQHADLDETRHTAALVLDHLLQPENTTYLMANPVHKTDAEHLIATVLSLQPPVHVILDVGALIIEWTSLDLAKAWLKAYGDKEAVVFVNEDDDLSIVDRLGHVSSFEASPFATRLSECLIYLDEAHTRGIDLKLPLNYRAAVTLGAHLTKDRLVQACMRMRQLGEGQTVVFCIPEEIQRKIREVTSMSEIDVQSVLIWAMSESCNEYRRHRPLWATQGERYYKQEIEWANSRKDGVTSLNEELSKAFLEPEAQTIADRYQPTARPRSLLQRLERSPNPKIRQIAFKCQDVENHYFSLTSLQEEQERELAPEHEQEVQIQRPPRVEAIQRALSELVRQFAMTGVLQTRHKQFANAFSPAFTALQRTSKGSKFHVSNLNDNHLWVTQDFANTVKLAACSHTDMFERSVQWILTSCADNSNLVQDAVIISPFEANQLYDIVKRSTVTTMHVFRPRCNIGHPSIDDLTFCNITARATPAVMPRKLALRLALFAGQLYFTSYDDYRELCSMLGLSSDLATGGADPDGFMRDRVSGRCGGQSGLTSSPVPFLNFLVSDIRRNGEAITKTHIGRILQGHILSEEEFHVVCKDEEGEKTS